VDPATAGSTYFLTKRSNPKYQVANKVVNNTVHGMTDVGPLCAQTKSAAPLDGRDTSKIKPVGRPVVYTSWFLSVLGLAISTYLTVVHFTSVANLYCVTTGVFNCAKVTTSPQSYFLGMPVAVLGLGYFIVSVGANSPWSWRSTSRLVQGVRVALSGLGMAFVLWLVSAELLIIKNFCLWCSGVHIVTTLIFLLSMISARRALSGTTH
jgi:uncharacterized membrane protein